MKSQKCKYKKIESEDIVPSFVLDGAKEELKKRQTEPAVKKKSYQKWSYAWVSIVCVLIVGIMTPIFVFGNKEANFNNVGYKYSDLTKNEIQSFDDYNKFNGTEYKHISANLSSYYEYKHKKKTVMLSQEISEDSKAISLWVLSDNIVVDIFEEYKNLEKQELLQDGFFMYEISSKEIKVNLFYHGWRYYLLLEGYNFEEAKEIMIQLIK